MRAIDLYIPVFVEWREAGIAAECTAAWEMWAQTVREAAAEFDVPAASMFDAFNGLDHDQDPREKGPIRGDRQHTSDEGKALQVEVLHALGYDPISK